MRPARDGLDPAAAALILNLARPASFNSCTSQHPPFPGIRGKLGLLLKMSAAT
jgi:hypothetical protein